MPFNEGDFVLVNYTLRIKGTGEVVDTTDPDIARKAGIYDEGKRYGPRLVVIGEGRLIKGLEKAIREMNVGEKKTVEIPPEEAYGKRDPSKVKILPRSYFTRQGIRPEPGRMVDIGGRTGIIRSVTGGRVVVDFNHPLAGKTLEAEIEVVKKVDEVPEKVKLLLLRRLPPRIEEDEVEVEYKAESKEAIVKLPGKIIDVPDAQLVKRIVVDEVARYIPEIEDMEFRERVHVAPPSKK
ncbi:MAG: peptidylprolyl isomerase [Crenarchaeota archaeon]|nr:peptidylprolyl isomerase [Thermoproteota archaeon]